MDDKKLKMSFDPHTIEHLGIKMYSVLPNAIAELIANAYDAEAETVYIKLYDTDNNKRIIVEDDGIGMSFDEVNNNFLRIGRKRRDYDNNGWSPNRKRKITGRKGLGKLAFFGIGDTITITTYQNKKGVKFSLKWQELINSSSDYEPRFEEFGCNDKKGTIIELSDLKRKSDFDKDGLAISLSKLFNFFDSSFKVYISHNDGERISIDNKLKYNNLKRQIVWNIPDDEVSNNNEYFVNNKIEGEIIATDKPLQPGLRGITLFAHGRLVNAPEFFGVGESSHAYSYLTGWLNVDFIDETKEDFVSTDRQSLSWDLPLMSELRENLKRLLRTIEIDWRKKRKNKRQEQINKQVAMDIDAWYDKLPENIKPNVENIIDTVVEHSELPNDMQNEIINTLHTLIPEYAYYHWRYIHEQVKDASYKYYQNEDYYMAVLETIKRYESSVKSKSCLQQEIGKDLMSKAFGKDGYLSVTKQYDEKISNNTKKNIEFGQQQMSAGIMAGVRNPLAHEEIIKLKTSRLFTEKDCLDMLSLLSHLFRRLDDAEKIK
ncbi:MAG: TIGR02391 family protein [Mucispirillum sp.]|nr:TIGR02391 family protein [Mucispirillum sp.]